MSSSICSYFEQKKARKKNRFVARAITAKEIARIVYHVLKEQTDFNAQFKGVPLSRTKQSQWPHAGQAPPPNWLPWGAIRLEWEARRCAQAKDLGLLQKSYHRSDEPVNEPEMVCGRHCPFRS